jgi:hypothetical protein
LVPSSTEDWPAYGTTFGKIPSRSETIFGYRLHLLITLNGTILDFELAPANVADLEDGFELLSEHTDLEVLGDKAYLSADKAAELLQQNRLWLKTLPRRNQKQHLPEQVKHLFNLFVRRLKSSTDNYPSSSTSRSIMPINLGFMHSALLQVDSSYDLHLRSSVVWKTRVSSNQGSGLSQLAKDLTSIRS